MVLPSKRTVLDREGKQAPQHMTYNVLDNVLQHWAHAECLGGASASQSGSLEVAMLNKIRDMQRPMHSSAMCTGYR